MQGGRALAKLAPLVPASVRVHNSFQPISHDGVENNAAQLGQKRLVSIAAAADFPNSVPLGGGYLFSNELLSKSEKLSGGFDVQRGVQASSLK